MHQVQCSGGRAIPHWIFSRVRITVGFLAGNWPRINLKSFFQKLIHLYHLTLQKCVNQQYNMLVCWEAGTKDLSTKRLMLQALFFIDLGHSKLFTFIFAFFLKNKRIDWKYFCKEFCKKPWKKLMLGTSDAWLTIHLSHRPRDRAWIYLRLTNFWGAC